MEPDTQPQLFQIPEQPRARYRTIAPIGSIHIRQDHAVLLAIAGLIGISVVFALGVERGKRLILASTPVAPITTVANEPQPPSQALDAKPLSSAPATGLQQDEAPKPAPTPAPEAATPKPEKVVAPAVKPTKTPIKSASRFAIQVVTYKQERFAKKECDRLKQRGEPAFLVTKKDRVVLYVGPFPSREHASAKLANLKQQYQDCFLRTL